MLRRIVPRRIVSPLFAFTMLAISACRPDTEPAPGGEQSEPGKTETRADPKVDPGPAGPLGPLPGGPIAIIGGDPIPMAAFRAIYDLKLKKYAGRQRPMTRRIDRRYRQSISERLIWAELVRREAEARGLSYPPAELEKLVEQDRLGTRNWQEDLVRRGESDASLRALHVTQLQEKAILEQEGALKVTDAEVEAEYEKAKSGSHADKDRVQLSQIVVETGESVTLEQAMAEATAVYEQARAPGADFAELAKQHSDVVTRQVGGDLGIQRVDQMDPKMVEVAAKLKVGEVSKPFETQGGVQLVKLIARFAPGPLPREALDPQLRAFLYNRKLQTGRDDLKKRLTEKYGVEDRMAAHLAALEK